MYATEARPNPSDPPSYDAPGSSECYYYPGRADAGEVVLAACAPGTRGRFVVIQLMSERDALNLCEVEIYGGKSFGISLTTSPCPLLKKKKYKIIFFINVYVQNHFHVTISINATHFCIIQLLGSMLFIPYID